MRQVPGPTGNRSKRPFLRSTTEGSPGRSLPFASKTIVGLPPSRNTASRATVERTYQRTSPPEGPPVGAITQPTPPRGIVNGSVGGLYGLRISSWAPSSTVLADSAAQGCWSPADGLGPNNPLRTKNTTIMWNATARAPAPATILNTTNTFRTMFTG